MRARPSPRILRLLPDDASLESVRFGGPNNGHRPAPLKAWCNNSTNSTQLLAVERNSKREVSKYHTFCFFAEYAIILVRLIDIDRLVRVTPGPQQLSIYHSIYIFRRSTHPSRMKQLLKRLTCRTVCTTEHWCEPTVGGMCVRQPYLGAISSHEFVLIVRREF